MYSELESAYPFGDNLIMVDMDGRTLLKVLEHSIRDSLTENVTTHGGQFLQVSGLQVSRNFKKSIFSSFWLLKFSFFICKQIIYDISKPIYSRVSSVKVRCGLCQVPVYEDLKLDGKYRVLMDDFIYNGGDGFYMLPQLKSQFLSKFRFDCKFWNTFVALT